MPYVKILNTDLITPPLQPYPPLTPLTFYDAFWINLLPIQRVFLYPNINNVSFPSIVQSLKSSLSQTLLNFHPFAGDLTFLPSGNLAVDCSLPTSGITFIEAESDYDICKISGDQVHDTEAYIQLVPELDVRVLPVKVMAVQVTEFVGGGVAVGFAALHTVVDGRGLLSFFEAWAAACRGQEIGGLPVHDRGVIGFGDGEEIARRYLSEQAPNLPKTAAPFLSIQDRLRRRLHRRTFILSSLTIHSLKQQLQYSNNHASSVPSTFTTIVAHAWVTFAHANINSTSDVTTLGFLADCRTRLAPPIPESYTGNCFRPCYATATWQELRDPQGFSVAGEKIARAVREGTADPLKGCGEWLKEFMELPQSSRFLVAGSPRFQVYETDFGFGKPDRVELVSMTGVGGVALVGGKEKGEVRVSLTLDAVRMDVFAELFMGGWEKMDLSHV